jgi:hypothetical protein
MHTNHGRRDAKYREPDEPGDRGFPLCRSGGGEKAQRVRKLP